MKKLLIYISIFTVTACANMGGGYNKDTSDSDQVNSPMTSSRAASS